MDGSALNTDLETAIKKCLPELSGDKVVGLVSCLREIGVIQFHHLRHMKDNVEDIQKLVDSGYVTRIQTARLIESSDESIFKEKENKERMIKEEDHKRDLELKLLELSDRKAQNTLELVQTKKEIYFKSMDNHTQLRSEAYNRIREHDNLEIKKSEVNRSGIRKFFCGSSLQITPREDRLAPMLKRAKTEAEAYEKKLLDDSGLETLQESICNIDEGISMIKNKLKAIEN